MDERNLDELHQKASAHYLRGEYDEALCSWRRMLDLAPREERALEGVRLCEQLAGGTESDVCTPGQSPFTVGAEMGRSSSRAGLAVADDPGDPAKRGPSADDDPLEAIDMRLGFKTDPPSGGLLDLSEFSDELADETAETVGIRPADHDAGPSDASWLWGGGGGEPAGEPAFEAGEDEPSAGDGGTSVSASLELRRRVNQLLAEALAAMEEGRRHDSLEILDRLLILDDENEAALSLREKIRLEAGEVATSQRVETLRVDEDPGVWDEGQTSADGDSSPARGAAVSRAAPERLRAEPVFDTDGESEGSDDPFDPLDAQGAAAPAPAERPAPSPGRRAPVLRRWLLIAVGTAGAAALAFLVWQRIGSDGTSGQGIPTAEQVAREVAASLATTSAEPALPEATERAVEPPGTPSTAEQDLTAILAQANEALAAEDFGEAVIAFNRARALRPDDATIAENLRLAGERFRQKQSEEKEWELARREFQHGNYQAALRKFYRLPPGNDQARVDRYLVIGWYNVGLTSLKGGECQDAIASFREAMALGADDAELRSALALATDCHERKLLARPAAAEDMPFRDLPD